MFIAELHKLAMKAVGERNIPLWQIDMRAIESLNKVLCIMESMKGKLTVELKTTKAKEEAGKEEDTSLMSSFSKIDFSKIDQMDDKVLRDLESMLEKFEQEPKKSEEEAGKEEDTSSTSSFSKIDDRKNDQMDDKFLCDVESMLEKLAKKQEPKKPEEEAGKEEDISPTSSFSKIDFSKMDKIDDKAIRDLESLLGNALFGNKQISNLSDLICELKNMKAKYEQRESERRARKKFCEEAVRKLGEDFYNLIFTDSLTKPKPRFNWLELIRKIGEVQEKQKSEEAPRMPSDAAEPEEVGYDAIREVFMVSKTTQTD